MIVGWRAVAKATGHAGTVIAFDGRTFTIRYDGERVNIKGVWRKCGGGKYTYPTERAVAFRFGKTVS